MKGTDFQKMSAMGGVAGATNDIATTALHLHFIPLQFWFCRNPGLALPLIALQYHEVKLKIKVNPSFMITLNNDIVYNVMVDYIYLDTDERRRFAQVSHEYLIEQVQRVQTVPTINVNLNFNHPVKEIIWVGSNYTNAKLTLNGHERFSAQEEEYFQLRQPFDYHTAIPGTNIPVKSNITMMNTHLSIGTDNELNFNDFITYVQETSEISNGLVTLNENNGQNPRIGDLVKVIVKDTKLDDDSTENLYGPFEYETGGGTPDAVLDILNDDNDFSIGQLGSLTSNDNLDETKPLFIVIRIGFLGSIFSVGDILDVRINDADGSVVNRKVTVDSVREATEIDGLAGSSTIHELGLDISLMAASTRAGGTLTFAAGDTIMIQKLGKRQNKLLNIASIDNIFTNTSFSLNDVTITAEDDFQLHIIGRTQFVEGRCSNFYDMINVYSFALNPEDHQPSGTCNFSRIDNAKLEFGQNTTVTTGMLNIYAVNYNVLRIMSGMGGLAYSN